MIKAIIFDMDGVLIDAKEWHYEALNRALALFGYTISRYDHLVTFDGLPTRKKLEMLTKEQGLPSGLHTVINDLKQRYTLEIVHAKCRPLFQHEYALSRLRAAGYKLGVASNAVRSSVNTMLNKARLDSYFDIMISNEDVRRPKPDPEIYTTASGRLGCHPSECLVLEDNHHGITAAEAAGANVMVIGGVNDVTWDNIRAHINTCDTQVLSPC